MAQIQALRESAQAISEKGHLTERQKEGIARIKAMRAAKAKQEASASEAQPSVTQDEGKRLEERRSVKYRDPEDAKKALREAEEKRKRKNERARLKNPGNRAKRQRSPTQKLLRPERCRLRSAGDRNGRRS